jgi:hypothetical protein
VLTKTRQQNAASRVVNDAAQEQSSTVDEFAQYMAEVFRLFGRITLRRMFAGHGIFYNGIMFGFVYDETLYLKVDAENVRDFQSQGLKQLEYPRIHGLFLAVHCREGALKNLQILLIRYRLCFDLNHRAANKCTLPDTESPI